MECFLPESRPCRARQCAGDPAQALREAWRGGRILEGRALCCSPEHDLTVDFGGVTGVIPRKEAALGIEEGVTKEIAILSRVGKQVCFTVLSPGEEGGTGGPVFSRRSAQREALDYLFSLPPGTVLPADVTHLEPFGAFLDVGCGAVSMLGLENCSVSRISHPAQRFVTGQEICVMLAGKEPEKDRVLVSHKELLGTWEENAALFSRGMTVPGYVRGVKPYGVFVELAPNLSGLAEPAEGVRSGDRVSVFLKAILPERRKIKLLIIDRLPPLPEPPPLRYFISEGRITGWRYGP